MIKADWLLDRSNYNSKAAWEDAQSAYEVASLRYNSSQVRWKVAREALTSKLSNFGKNSNPDFEKAFGAIAFTYISEKAPGLLPYIEGFQLLDRSDDGDKAAGAFVAKLGDRIIDIPMFFVNGELKGHQLMRVRNPEMFVPLRESFLDYLIGQMPQDLGEAGRDESAPSTVQATPSIQPFSGSRYLKASSESMMHAWAANSADEAYASMRYNPTNLELGIGLLEKKASSHVDLFSLLSSHLPLLKTAADLCDAYPSFRAMLDRHLGEGWLVKAASALPSKPAGGLKLPKQDVPHSGVYATPGPAKLRFVYHDDPLLKLGSLQSERSDEIAEYGCYIEDNRGQDKLADIFKIEDDPSMDVEIELFNAHIEAPLESGIYEVVMANGQKRDCYIFPSMRNLQGKRFDLIIDKETGDYCHADRNGYICYQSKYDTMHPDEYQEQGAIISNKDRPAEGDTFLLVPNKHSVSGPYHAWKKDAPDVYHVHCGCDANAFRKEVSAKNDNECWWFDLPYNPAQKHEYLPLPKPYPPRVSEVHFVGGDNKSMVTGLGSNIVTVHRDTGVFVLRGTQDLKLMSRSTLSAWEVGKYANLHVENKLGNEVVINSESMRRGEARTWLVERGVAKAAAEAIVNGPQIRTPYILSPIGRRIDSMDALKKNAFYSPAVPFAEPDEDLMPSESGRYQMTNPEVNTENAPKEETKEPLEPWQSPEDVNPRPMSIDSDMQNLMSGDGTEIMDDMLGLVSLLRNSRIDSTLKQTTKALMSAIDKLGRQIFVFHAHPDEFADTFGEDELDDIESAMNSTFENAGDLFITLSRTNSADAAELDSTSLPGLG